MAVRRRLRDLRWGAACALVRLRERMRDQRGQDLVEYSLIVVVIAIALIAIVTTIGRQTSNMYSDVTNAMDHG